MIVVGLELEEHQRRLKVDAAALGQHATDLQRAKLIERQNTLQRKIDAWREVQLLYMPGVAAHRQRTISTDTTVLPQHVPLLLPSAVCNKIPCDTSLLEQEWRLRHAQAHDVLNDLRGHLELRSHLYKYKDRFVRGQHHNTRARTIITGVQSKVDADVSRYRTAQAALVSMAAILGKSGWQAALWPLNDGDVRHVTEGEDGESEGRRTLSWIWKACGAVVECDKDGRVQEHLQDSLRREWCKARARAYRWWEECKLLEEEMRRVLAFHVWMAQRWRGLLDRQVFTSPGYMEGANAYAHRQAEIRLEMHNKCTFAWRHVQEWLSLQDSAPPFTQD
ncbi:hypothetical protein A0H81_12000 [Grifola frondosa]|uniref:Uncharacterized protein n=1 Tax=Grifola frondosa TaxID=5627 RepID=A0A1C7LTU7_GRIFR|nr:hypothetical protein A0H81_12000 [Grifola frondosa]